MTYVIPENPPEVQFGFERLVVYQAALTFRDLIRPVFRASKAGTAELRDQVNRASLSIIANVAEGAGKTSAGEKSRFYSIALASVTECVALLTDCFKESLIDQITHRKARYIANAIVAMLTGLRSSVKGGSRARTAGNQ